MVNVPFAADLIVKILFVADFMVLICFRFILYKCFLKSIFGV